MSFMFGKLLLVLLLCMIQFFPDSALACMIPSRIVAFVAIYWALSKFLING